MGITDEMKKARKSGRYAPVISPRKRDPDPITYFQAGDVEKAWEEGRVDEIVNNPNTPVFIRDTPLDSIGTLLATGYEFLDNEFVGNQRVGKAPDGRVHILGSYQTVIETYIERGFASVALAQPVGDASALEPDFCVAVYVKRK
ncbi:MAG: hypothetical protein HYS53_00615 [Candidatus Aenigmarchaeota archaeon]|nr:hypothetical protein [Candidatus Aenigmarchaeota archaeon]